MGDIKTWVVVMRMAKWADLQVEIGPEFAPRQLGSIGFLPIYETMEEAQAEYPDGPFWIIQAAEEQCRGE